MSQTLKQIAQRLHDANKKVQLIYAFNGTGKTRLSRVLKDLVAPKPDEGEEGDGALSRHIILYYNAFTEDLFYWDNDLEGDGEPKLKIQPNSFTDWILKDQGQEVNITRNFQRYANDKLNPTFNQEYTRDAQGGGGMQGGAFGAQDGANVTVKAFSEVTFSLDTGGGEPSGNFKISKGEGSNFVWSVFYTLLEEVIAVRKIPEAEDRSTNQFDKLKYVFIDDPVSSLDENPLIELAVDLAALIRPSDYTNGNGMKFIITTHNPLFCNALYSEMKAKSGHILSRFDDGSFELEEKRGASNKAFAYHLHIKNLIEQAIAQQNVQRHHFMLLRNLYEKTAAFLGYREWTDLLDTVEGDKKAYFNRIIQFSSHSPLSNEEISEPTEPEKQTVGLLLET